MNILVIGGAGYVGSHAAHYLENQGHAVWVYDSLVNGHRQAVLPGRLIEGDVADRETLEDALREKRIEAVMHFAAFSLVGESVTDPAKYYRNNISNTIGLLDSLRRLGIKKFVFSSTTATYGEPDRIPITEDTPQNPINTYGFTKLVVEHALADYARAYGLGYAALRYFNAAGAHPDGHIGEDHRPETHLIPIVLQVALGQRDDITVFGEDYATDDGTCVRDYIHVMDLASAHLAALELLQPGQGICVNVGTGRGTSVREVIDACREVTGHDIPVILGERREGDPPKLIADATLARNLLGWTPEFTSMKSIVQTAWNWHKDHPNGYTEDSTVLQSMTVL
ncbi:MAG: UDP-glucose 4-epimerase [Pirellulaceae bacterium]|jgi:UDP-glucose 4-epimerase